ncbi:GAF domain-containing protein [Aliidiomarina halalkaliphila]|uniref:GAF domain-containing protein n=1 Tax=Aliidiomarina halalkaliphila TaxID=2593535 RepID=A0A552X543_9GAMM|nr:GAF domain-containing protein [Aliidiomarina halalkaliphila]TRW49723.1 GAF domain-containing protein [Aliidiomarina halalkaliphila]
MFVVESHSDKGTADFYASLGKQLAALTSSEPDLIANLANISAVLYDQIDRLNWLGFYIVKQDELVLGPFQGKVACVRIGHGKGVCGAAWATGKTQRVDDVHAFPGHIACDSASNSELVVPIFYQGKVVAVLDIDSPETERFTADDQAGVEALMPVFEQLAWDQVAA